MKRYQWRKVNSPLVELECGGKIISPKHHIENASINPNFPDPVATLDVVCEQTTHGLSMMSLCDVVMVSYSIVMLQNFDDLCGFSLHMVTQKLPKEDLYAPPLNIRIFDKRNFGFTQYMPLVGIHIIKSLKDFRVDPDLPVEQEAADQGGEEKGNLASSSRMLHGVKSAP